MEPVTACRAFVSKRPVESQATRGPFRIAELSVSILCQDHEVLDGTMGQTDLDVDAAKSLNRLKVWLMVTIGSWPAENSKTFGLTPVGVRFPLPAPFKIRPCATGAVHSQIFGSRGLPTRRTPTRLTEGAQFEARRPDKGILQVKPPKSRPGPSGFTRQAVGVRLNPGARIDFCRRELAAILSRPRPQKPGMNWPRTNRATQHG
jgi:hypothetical protein